jgi:hypothetical protein
LGTIAYPETEENPEMVISDEKSHEVTFEEAGKALDQLKRFSMFHHLLSERLITCVSELNSILMGAIRSSKRHKQLKMYDFWKK